MNYSRNTKKKVTDRILISWVVVFLLGLALGCGIFAIGNAATLKKEDAAPPVEIQKYGTYDGKVFTSEMSSDWSNGLDLGFVPLDCEMDADLQEFVYCLSYGYNMDFPFVMAVMQRESQFNPNVISSTNDYGLMQINEINHQWLKESLGIEDFLNPYQNTRAGLFILRKLFEKYEDPQKVLMAYNMGESGAACLWDKGIYSTDYSESIMKSAADFSKQIQQEKEGIQND